MEGETLYRGWRDPGTRLWRFNIDPNDGNRLIPLPDDDVVNNKTGVILSAMEFDERTGVVYTLLHQSHNESINALYECRNKEELIKYLHASLCSHPKTTLIAAATAGYLRGFPALTAESIARYIRIEEATEAGHMRARARGAGSTTKRAPEGGPS